MNSAQCALPRPRPRHRRRLAAVGVLATGALLLAGCGSDDAKNTAPGSGDAPTAARKSASNPAPGASNDADITFAQRMIPHHQQAVAMARLADGRASDPETTSLAAAIAKAQGPEITTMRAWLKAWGAPAPSAHGMPGMDHGSGDMPGMAGMMSAKDMTDLKAARGKDFDEKFARMMIGHHNGAITMARDERRNGRNATAKKLAGDVIEHQTAEVATLRRLLDRL
ncbi:DUF305 domain-containing protein [Streptomyces kronopolitis]|uniref:DUF305 domain-containing protein n=1 Tax=Streptomyces kronopolitis TaxID=1612435 RepID=UPI00341B516D